MNELDNLNILLLQYAKGHFGHKNILKLKTILDNWSGTETELYNTFTIYELLVETFVKVSTPMMVYEFMRKMFNQDLLGYRLSPQPITYDLLIDDLLSYLSLVPVLDDKGNKIIDLGIADQSLLAGYISTLE